MALNRRLQGDIQAPSFVAPRPKPNFADAVKHGITSYSPFKHHLKHEESAEGGQHHKKHARFGPPKVQLNDRELEELVNHTRYRATTAASQATTVGMQSIGSPMMMQQSITSNFHSRSNSTKHHTNPTASITAYSGFYSSNQQ
jgi:hypothetical protein